MRFYRLTRLLLLFLLGFAPAPLAARDPKSTPPADVGLLSAGERAPVAVDGRVLFRLVGLPSLPAALRAEKVTERILEIAEDATFDPRRIATLESTHETRIVAGDRQVVRVLDADGDAEGVNRWVLAEIYEAAVREAIVSYRAARTPSALAASARQVALTTALFLVAVVLVRGLFRRFGAFLAERFGGRLRALRVGTYEVVRAEKMRAFVQRLVRTAETLVLFVAAFLFIERTLAALPWTRGLSSQLDDWLLAPFGMLARGLVEKLPDLVFLAVVFVLTRYLLRAVHLFFAAVGRGELELRGFDRDWAEPTFKLVRLAIVAVALVVAYPYIPGSSTAAFKGVSILTGVVFSFGSSSAIANLVAGYSLIYRRAFHEGDLVRIGDAEGIVTARRLQATHLTTFKNVEIVVPSSTIVSSEVQNYSALAETRGLLLHTTVGIGYETAWRQVESMLLEAARRTSGLRETPAPFVRQLGLGDFAVTYELNVACEDPRAMRDLYSQLHSHILDVFNEQGVQIMTPAYVSDPEIPKVVPKS